MSAFKQKMAKLGVRAGLLAGASAAVLAISGIGASSAFAAECPTTALGIEGKGASLQKVAQEQWTGRLVPSGEPLGAIPHAPIPPEATKVGYRLACESAQVSYTSTGSGPGLKAFGFTSTEIENGQHGKENEHTISYVGSDDAPTTAQIENAESLTTGGKATGSNAIIVPVAETAIAMIYNPPATCTMSTSKTKGITHAELTKAFGGKELKKFSEFTHSTQSGTCTGEITRVVRKEGSGTTFQFKNYLAKIVGGLFGGKNMPCELTGDAGLTKEWAHMKAIGAEEKPNIVWPEVGNCAETTPVVRAAGGGAVVKYVSEHPGTIGYAALPDVKSSNNIGNAAKVAFLQNTEEELGSYGGPEGASETSNCGNRIYTVPVGGREGETAESIDWSGVFGAAPTVGGELFPLCTLTYDVAWGSAEGSGYTKAGYTSAATRADNVKKYLNYVVKEGQGIGKWYQALPTGVPSKATNVKAAAEAAVAKIK